MAEPLTRSTNGLRGKLSLIHIYTPQANRIYRRTENAMLRERIHYTRKELALNDQELLVVYKLSLIHI